MLKSTTKMPRVRKLNASVRLRRTVKKRVDSPMIMARVPSMENRSFHMLMVLSSEMRTAENHYIFFTVSA